MTKILNIISNGLRREGISTTQLAFIRAMKKDNIQMDFVAIAGSAEDVIAEFEENGCKVIRVPDREKNTAGYVWSLYRLLKKEKYNAVHVHGSSAILAIDLLTAKLAGVPVRIAHSRSTRCEHEKVDRLLRPIFYRSYTHAYASGREAGEWLFPGKEFTVLHNGKDLTKFCFSPEIRKAVRERYDLEGKTAVGFVGNLNRVKNIPFLLDVMTQYSRMEPDSAFFIMGDGAERAYAEAEMEKRGLAGKTVFTGRIPNVHEMLQAMDIMLLTSLYEGLPNVVLEWQAEGLPCVISDGITRECAPSDLVTFLPLEAGALAWAEKIRKSYAAPGTAGKTPRKQRQHCRRPALIFRKRPGIWKRFMKA